MSKKTVYKALIENWGYVKRNVKLADVVDHLIQKDIISIEQWSELKKNTNLTEKERMEEFMMDFFKKDNPEVIRTFLEALRENQYEHVADLIDGGSSKYNNIHYFLRIYFNAEKKDSLCFVWFELTLISFL